jgi:tripartite-type tricarboxylate transporter receptor subunit TctC
MKQTLLALIILLLASLASAQPSKQLTIITSFPVGSGPDSVLRKIQPDLSKTLGSTIIIENKPGGNGAVAFDACNRAVNDSQNISLCYTEAAVVWAIPLIYGKDDLVKNLKFFTLSHYAPLVLVTSTNIPTRQEFINHVKAHPNYGSWSIGSVGQISGQELVNQLRLSAEHVPYKDYGQWLMDVSNQNLGFSFPTLGSATPLYRAGKIKFIAVASKHRDSVFSDVPTVDEYFGKSNFVPLGAYAAFYVKKDMPEMYEKTLLAGLKQVLNTTDVKSDLLIRGYRPWTHTDAETTKILSREQAHYYQALKQFDINLRP